MIRKLLVVFVTIFTVTTYAQKGGDSPYSFYGIGSLKFKGTVENRSMGSLSIYTDSIHINLRNPASFSGPNLTTFDNENRPVKYTIGGSYSSTNLESNTTEAQATTATFDYFALAFPVGKFGVGIGILPFTSVGYRLETENDNGEPESRFSGDGGLNKAFLGFAYSFTDGLQIGVNGQYNFGNIEASAISFGFDSNGVPLVAQSREESRSDLSGVTVDFGVSYKRMVTKSLELVTAATYTPQSNLTSKNQRALATVLLNQNTGQEIPRDESDVNLDAQGLRETDLTLPTKFSFGAGIGQPRKWFVGAEYEFQNTSTFSNPFFQTPATTYENASRFSVGGFYIPRYNAFSSFYKRVVYRAGFRMEQTGLNIQTESIDEFGISFGVGIPVGKFGSNANIGFEIGQRGTTNNNLVEENFINLQLSLSLNDKWFQKRKFD